MAKLVQIAGTGFSKLLGWDSNLASLQVSKRWDNRNQRTEKVAKTHKYTDTSTVHISIFSFGLIQMWSHLTEPEKIWKYKKTFSDFFVWLLCPTRSNSMNSLLLPIIEFPPTTSDISLILILTLNHIFRRKRKNYPLKLKITLLSWQAANHWAQYCIYIKKAGKVKIILGNLFCNLSM